MRRAGLVLLDKPAGLTSQQATSRVKRLLRARKAGHCGTLDPAATGLLPILVGPGTRLAAYLADQEKVYEAVVRLGAQTDTLDQEGQVVAEAPVPDGLTLEAVRAVARSLEGWIEQRVPAFSAVRVQGERLYELARRGRLPEDLPVRRVFVRRLEVLACEPPLVRIRVTCGKGTYVRVLGADLAAALGTVGSLQALRRLRVGHLDVSEAVTLEQLETARDPWSLVRSAGEAVAHLPTVQVPASQMARLVSGVVVDHPGPAEGLVVVWGDEALVVAEARGGRLRPRRVIHALGSTS